MEEKKSFLDFFLFLRVLVFVKMLTLRRCIQISTITVSSTFNPKHCFTFQFSPEFSRKSEEKTSWGWGLCGDGEDEDQGDGDGEDEDQNA